MATGANEAAEKIMSLDKVFREQDLEILDIMDLTPLHSAIAAENSTGLELLVKKCSKSFADLFFENHENIVQYAIKKGNRKCVEVLKRRFYNYENKIPEDIPEDVIGNWTLLHFAAADNKPMFLKVLLEMCPSDSYREMRAKDRMSSFRLAQMGMGIVAKFFRENINSRAERKNYKPREERELISLKAVEECYQCVNKDRIDRLEELIESDHTLLTRQLRKHPMNLLHYCIMWKSKQPKFVECLLNLENKNRKNGGVNLYLETKTVSLSSSGTLTHGFCENYENFVEVL
eukprot:TRINITY_DN1198_c0_g1_i4.p1 TRINITY_DN1198_c0_g1~~TRINITY_DN1198_c0_g1_i4.p1  ORF type:complete len:289 (-),score=54.03 TRINITY_DN1198_c0_g1_i4:1537-2403(-)